MNTGQKYTRSKGSAKCNYQTVNSGLIHSPVDGNSASQLPFEPSFISIPVGLAMAGRNADSYGTSQVDVLMCALKVYEAEVSAWPTAEDKEITLGLIDELKESVLDAMYNRLSGTSIILRDQQYSAKRASK